MTTSQKMVSRSPKREGTQVTSIRFSEAEVKEIDQLAHAEDRSRSAFVRSLFFTGLEIHKKQKAGKSTLTD